MPTQPWTSSHTATNRPGREHPQTGLGQVAVRRRSRTLTFEENRGAIDNERRAEASCAAAGRFARAPGLKTAAQIRKHLVEHSCSDSAGIERHRRLNDSVLPRPAVRSRAHGAVAIRSFDGSSRRDDFEWRRSRMMLVEPCLRSSGVHPMPVRIGGSSGASSPANGFRQDGISISRACQAAMCGKSARGRPARSANGKTQATRKSA
jgi:hypothetical protein